LRNALAREGQLEPIDLTDSDPHHIIDGFRRLAAIRELGWSTVRAIVRRGVSTERAHQIAFDKNVVRKNLRPIEKANAMRLAIARGCTSRSIASQFGISEKQMRRYEDLLDLPKRLRELIDAGDVSMAHAEVLARFDGIDVVEWAQRAARLDWSAPDLRRELRRSEKPSMNGRKRDFVHCSATEVRSYAWRLSEKSSMEDLERAAAAFERAIQAIHEVRRLKSDRPDPRAVAIQQRDSKNKSGCESESVS
jgi:ParB/RepB/Spo0J family partition protein